MEFWDIYTIDREKTGRTSKRGTKLNSGDCHMVIHVCVFNKQGQMLIQQRQPYKESWPNYWDFTVAGNTLAGETSSLAAMRELYEEIGLKLDLTTTRPHLTIHFEEGFDDVYLVEAEVDLTELTLQTTEVQAVQWADEDMILQMMRSGQFVPYQQSMIALLFSMRHGLGSIRKTLKED